MPAAPRNAQPGAAAPPGSRGFQRIARLTLSREIAPLAGAIGAYGMVNAFLNPTASLFLADAVHATPLLIGLFFVGRGLVAIVINQVTGRISDKLPDRRFVIGVSGAVGAVGALGFALLRDYVAVFVVGAVAFGIGGVCFSQLFAYTKELAQERGRPVTAFMSVVRAVFSAAWVIGPPIGLFVFARFGFGPLYLATAGLSLVTAVLGRWFLPRVPVPPPQVAASRRRLALPARTWLLLCAVVALGVVNQMYNIDIALYVTKDLRLGTQLIGWMAGAGAALEIPVMIVCGRFADRIGKLRVVLAATVAATVFFCLLPLARTAVALLALQLLNAAWVAVAMSIPMVMVQEEAPGGAGAASSLYGSAFTIAALLAGAVTGVTATAVGYGNVFWVCAALSAVSGGLLLARAGVRRGGRGSRGRRRCRRCSGSAGGRTGRGWGSPR